MPLDEMAVPLLIDHFGVRLWRLATAWKAEFETEMLRRGYPWVSEARGAIIGHLRPGGRAQAELATVLEVSKQAIQQFVDDLVAEGAVERIPDPHDGRGKIVRLTPRGIAFIVDGNVVKRQIEARYARRIGHKRLDALIEALDDLMNDEKK
jgi:DNA-binding MarR family transcriptional regulator